MKKKVPQLHNRRPFPAAVRAALVELLAQAIAAELRTELLEQADTSAAKSQPTAPRPGQAGA